MELAGDGGEGVVGCEAMVAPCVALCFRDEGDALFEQGSRAGRQMQVKAGVGWRNHVEQTGVEGSQFIDRGIDQVGDQAEID